MEISKKFNRGKNYNTDDKQLLLCLVESKKDILECKFTNKVSREAKKEAWSSIEQLYNAGTTNKRTANQLKILYENLKRRTKQDVAMENKDRYREIKFGGQSILAGVEEQEEEITANLEELQNLARQEKKETQKKGGGPMSIFLTDHDHQIISMIGHNIAPLNNVFDDAAVYFADSSPLPENPSLIPIENAGDPIHSPHCDIETRPPIPRRTRKLPKKIVKRKMSLKDRYYEQKLKNSRIEAQILLTQLRREKISLKKAMLM